MAFRLLPPGALEALPMSIDNRHIGREGEKLFDLLCTRAGVSCNRSVEDDFGWDFHIEFPPVAKPRLPIDERPTGQAALVQIKTTRGRTRRWRISLQNALRLAKRSTPTFLILVALGVDAPPTYYAVHIWHDRIVDILKAGRLADARGETALNKATIPIVFTAADAVPEAELLAWMEAEINGVGKDYGGQKAAFVESAGFEDGYGTARIEFPLDDPDAIVELQLGLRDSVDISFFSYTSERFGIASARPQVEVEGGSLLLSQEPRTGRLRVRRFDGLQLVVPATVVTGGLPGVPGSSRARLCAGPLDILYHPGGTSRATATIDPQATMSMDAIALVALLNATPADKPVELLLMLGEDDIDLGTLTITQAQTMVGWPAFLGGVLAIRRIAEFAHRLARDTSLAAVDDAAEELHALYSLVSAPAMRLEKAPEDPPGEKIHSLVGYSLATVDGMAYGAVAERMVAHDLMDGTTRRIFFSAPTILDAFVGEDAEAMEAKLATVYAQHLERINAVREPLELGDMRVVAKTQRQERDNESCLPKA